MTASKNNSFRVALLDIEGTTTPIDFVYQTLFPFVRKHLKNYLAENFSNDDMRLILAQLLEENAQDIKQNLQPPVISGASQEAKLSTATAYLYWLMDIDRKSTPLKSLQGKIWQQGYQGGELFSEVFADVPQAMSQWHKQGKTLAIFSSGSVLAQKLLFAHTAAGDLTKFISHYFDTNIGAKREAESYQRIAEALQHAPQQILFFSDVVAELDAAQAAGMQTALCVRPGNAPQTSTHTHKTIQTLAEMF